MAHNNHNHMTTCRHCGERHRMTNQGFRWVHPETYQIVRRGYRLVANGTYRGRTVYRDEWPDRVAKPLGLIRSQLAEIACAKRMGRRVDFY